MYGRLTQALADLSARGVRCIVVGGVAATLHGAAVQTFDLDLVYSLEAANLERLLEFLAEADAIFRIQPERKLRPGISHLAGGGHLNLDTRFGPIDLLGNIGRNLRFDDLLPRTLEMEIADGLRVPVLDLETIIAVKEQLGTEKDRAALPILYQTLRRSSQP